ncbi:uncharacterized protein LOC143459925 [Clavelina lepadiformis]|uniref:uncharacterized protein LOC143459925 n=1 Tax=Clavelina lepadiformis TaxID=159417 RepID=UPI004042241E
MAATATSLKTQLQEDVLTCAICCSQYVDPRVLKCQHSFCHSCLQGCLKANRSNSIKCAICRKMTKLTKKGLADVPSNFVINGLLQMVKEQKVESPLTSKHSTKETLKPESRNKLSSGKNQAKTGGKVAALKAVYEKGLKDKNDNKPLLKRGYADDNQESSPLVKSSSSDTESSSMEEFTLTDDDNSYSYSDSSTSYDDETTSTSSSDSASNSSDYTSDAIPAKPNLKSCHGIKVGMAVCVFSKSGRPNKGIVRILEKFNRKAPLQTHVYAGVELERENDKLTTDDIEDMDESYLFYWLMDFDEPCAVVRVDQCCPTKWVDELMCTI